MTTEPPSLKKPNHSAMSLRIFGDALDPADTTILLKCNPSRSHKKGDLILRPDGSAIWNESTSRYSARNLGMWSLEADDSEPADIEGQMRALLAHLPADPEVWTTISQKYGCKIEFFCGFFMQRGNESLELSAEILTELSKRNIWISFDLYSALEEDLSAVREYYEGLDAKAEIAK
jgi:Domain of unknown function (DUF4279)